MHAFSIIRHFRKGYMDALREKVEGICVKKNVLLKYLYQKPELDPSEIMTPDSFRRSYVLSDQLESR